MRGEERGKGGEENKGEKGRGSCAPMEIFKSRRRLWFRPGLGVPDQVLQLPYWGLGFQALSCFFKGIILILKGALSRL